MIGWKCCSAQLLFAFRCSKMRFAKLALLLLIASFTSLAHAEPPFVSGEVLVRYAPGVGTNEIAALNAAHGVYVLEVIPELGVYRLAIPSNKSVHGIIADFSRNPRFERAEPNYIGQGGDFFPTDTFFDRQWHLHNTGQAGGTADADIDAVEGWQLSRGDEQFTIAVLDSGIDFGHPDLAGRILPGFDFVNEDSDPSADHAHGVYVSGIIAANADNEFSVAGVDHFAMILPVKVLDADNFGTLADLAQGLVYSADQGADVINMSLINYPVTGTITSAMQYARDAGSILIACAGNGGIGDADHSGPGKSPLTISVGATDRKDARASFSGTGTALDVVAPGLSVGTVRPGFSGDSYSTFSGCSAATPVVAGIASLLLSVDPLLTHDDVLDVLALTADDLVGPIAEDTPGRDDFFGHGRVNLHQALIEVPEPAQALQLAAGGGLLLVLTRARSRATRRRARARPAALS